MAAYLYMAFHHAARAQLLLLPREVGNLRCCFAVNRIKRCYFFHQSFSKNMSSYDFDSETVKEKYTERGKSKNCIHTEQSVTDGVNVQSLDIHMNERHELHDFHPKSKTDSKNRQNNPSEQALTHSRGKQNKNVSQYFKQSWLNYYSSVSQSTENSSEQNHLQLKTQLSEKKSVRMNVKDKSVNTFGNLSMEISNRSRRPDERNPNERIDEEIQEDTDERRDRRLDIPLSRYGRINKKSFYYTRKMSIMGRQGKIKEAIAIFEDLMMVRDRVMPNKRTFVVLIGILGRVGYTEKAFELFKKMKNLGLDPEDHIYTSLFNACANSPFHAEGLRCTEYLLNYMKEEGIHPNSFTVKAAMKALAISGDYSCVFTLLDGVSKRLELDADCFSHLLIACISDKETGFKRALQVWQKMSQYRIQPSTTIFNLLIRTARDCGIGDPKTFSSVFALDSGYVEINGGLGLLEGVNHSFGKRQDTGQNLSLHTSALLTDGTRKSDLKLGVIGSKINIHSSLSSVPSSKCSDDVTFNVSKQNVICDITYNDHINEQVSLNNFISSGITRDNRGITRDNRADHSDCVSDKDLSDSLAHLKNNSKSASQWLGEEKPSDLNNSQVDTASSVSSRTNYGDNFKSLYSSLLTKDTRDILNDTKVSQIYWKDLKLPYARLSLIGGANKFISFMESMGVYPDLKTFTQILACIPNDEQSEFELLTLMEKRGVKPDIDFLNDIMMRRNTRRDIAAVKAVLTVISQLRLSPNMRTYAALSLTCIKEIQAHQFLQDMKEAKLEPNSVIMGHLIYISSMNFTYKLKMLKTVESLGLKATKEIIATIEKSIILAKAKMIEAENEKVSSNYFSSEHFQRSFQYFLRYYKTWLMRTDLEKPRHPWEAYKPTPYRNQENKGLLDTVS